MRARTAGTVVKTVLWLRFHVSLQRAQIQSLVRELKSHVPWSAVKIFFKKARKKYIVNKSDKSHKKFKQLEEPHDRFGPGKEELGQVSRRR